MIRASITALCAAFATLPAAAHHEAGFVPGHPGLMLALMALWVSVYAGLAVRRAGGVKGARRAGH